ncbi:hypothetical protein GS982_20500 [Rhodococcus hoagii]|nr:hypothetical protein [Prescottella equi]NKZ84576.1 hypothetical protein [Prescottella equi]
MGSLQGAARCGGQGAARASDRWAVEAAIGRVPRVPRVPRGVRRGCGAGSPPAGPGCGTGAAGPTPAGWVRTWGAGDQFGVRRGAARL